jgi:CRP-like cAMP-binding protein
VRWLRTRWGWDDRHDELASHPLLTGLSRTVIRRLALDGDEVEFDAGQELLREDHIGYWFFLVGSGTAVITDHGEVIRRVGAGGHFGEVAILGFRPQPATVTAETSMRAWVFGRRQFLGLAYSEAIVQRRLFPGVDAAGFAAKLRELREVGTTEWRALSARPEWRAALTASPLRELRPGRAVSRRPASLIPFVPLVSRSRSSRVDSPVDVSLSWRSWAVVSAIVAVIVGAAALLYHPPLVVVSAGHPVDVSADAVVRGATTYPLHGRYVLLPVRFSRPNAVGAIAAAVRHRTRAPLAGGDSREARAEASREARAAFKQSRVDAVNAAALAAHLDPRVVHATFRRRAISGPSAGLIYALVLYDLLTPDDVARGRTVVATGSIDAAGGVGEIGFIREKSTSARRVRADVFLVPSGQTRELEGRGRVVGVGRLRDAITALAA